MKYGIEPTTKEGKYRLVQYNNYCDVIIVQGSYEYCEEILNKYYKEK